MGIARVNALFQDNVFSYQAQRMHCAIKVSLQTHCAYPIVNQHN